MVGCRGTIRFGLLANILCCIGGLLVCGAGAEVLNATLCIVAPASLAPTAGTLATIGVLEMISHFNAGVCDYVEDCAGIGSLPPPDGYDRIHLDAVIFDDGMVPASGVQAVYKCADLGGAFIVGSAASSVTSSMSLMGSALNLPTISFASTSPSLSDSTLYTMTLRTIASDAGTAIAMVSMIRHFGWENVAVIYPADIYGSGFVAAMEKEIQRVRGGNDLKPIRLNMFQFQPPGVGKAPYDKEMFKNPVNNLKVSGIRIVVMVVYEHLVTTLVNMMEMAGLLADPTYQFITIDSYSPVVVKAIAEEEGLDVTDFLRGTIRLIPAVHKSPRTTALEATLANWTPDRFVEEVVRRQDPPVKESAVQRVAASILPLQEGGEASPFFLMAYDAAWSAALAIATLASGDGLAGGGVAGGRGVAGRGDELFGIMTDEKFQFAGVTGSVAFDENGDRDFDTALYAIQATVPCGEDCINEVRVGTWMAGGGLQFENGTEFLWRDGSKFPGAAPADMVDDGTEDPTLPKWGIALLAVALVVSLLTAGAAIYFFWRSRNIIDKAKLNQLDLEAPITKVVNALEGVVSGKSLSKDRAAELLNMVLMSDNLNSPDIVGQLDRMPYTKEMSQFLLYSVISNDVVASKENLRTITSSFSRTPWGSSLYSLGGGDGGSDGGNVQRSMQLGVDSAPDNSEEAVTMAHIHTIMQDVLGIHFNLDIYEISEMTNFHPLYYMSLYVCSRFGLTSRLNLNMKAFKAFLHKCESGYFSENPYHNSTHAADVVARLANIIEMSGALQSKISPAQILAAILAAVVHDFLHPGTSNAYHVATGNALARHYNDQHVLENHSLMTTLTMMQQPEMNFLANVSVEDNAVIRNTMISMVLATDLTVHFDVIGEFSSKFPKAECPFAPVDLQGPRVNAFLKMALKAADLGHTTMPVPQHILWVQGLQEEFFNQGDNEKREGLTISPLMDRTRPGPCHGENQMGFFDVIVLPMYERLASVFPRLAGLHDSALLNRRYWGDMATESMKHGLSNNRPFREGSRGRSRSLGSPTDIRVSVDLQEGAGSTRGKITTASGDNPVTNRRSDDDDELCRSTPVMSRRLSEDAEVIQRAFMMVDHLRRKSGTEYAPTDRPETSLGMSSPSPELRPTDPSKPVSERLGIRSGAGPSSPGPMALGGVSSLGGGSEGGLVRIQVVKDVCVDKP